MFETMFTLDNRAIKGPSREAERRAFFMIANLCQGVADPAKREQIRRVCLDSQDCRLEAE